GDAGAAHHLPALQQQHAAPGAGEVRRGDEAVVAGPHDDRVVIGAHGGPFPARCEARKLQGTRPPRRAGERRVTGAPIKFARVVAIACCAARPFAAGACAARSAPSASAAAPIPLHVANANFADVRVYLVRGGMWFRLGLVTSNNTAEFTIPAEFTGPTGGVLLVAIPVAGPRAWVEALPTVLPGDELELVIEAFLQYTHVVVR